MKKILWCLVGGFFSFYGYAQTDVEAGNPALQKANAEKAKIEKVEQRKKTTESFVDVKIVPVTDIKNQGITGTCWCFSGTSLVESQCVKNNLGTFDLSEMYSVRNTYLDKAKNYILRQGRTQFSEGGLGHDLINAIVKYGAIPEAIYSGAKPANSNIPSKFASKVTTETKPIAEVKSSDAPTTVAEHNHVKLITSLKGYLDSIIGLKIIPENWDTGFERILDTELGVAPSKFIYDGKEYTPKTFASNVLKFNADDYVNITSFTDHSFYRPFILQVPDNFSNGAYYNLPLDEMMQLTKDALNKGYSVLWDADVSNDGFMQKIGVAINMNKMDMGNLKKAQFVTGNATEGKWDAEERQRLFENLTTQDDHLMHIIGMGKNKEGKSFFNVKNSWGDIGPNHGFINVSEGYFAINTISLIVPKAALSKAVLEKLKMK